MRRILSAMLIFVLLIPAWAARGNTDWEIVKDLKPGTRVQIVLWSGEKFWGAFVSASDATLRVAVADRSDIQFDWLREVDRAFVRRIVSLPTYHEPDREVWIATGAFAGGAIGDTTGVIQNKSTWPLAALAGAAIGAFVSLIAVSAVSVVKTAQLPHHRKVVCEDKGNQS